MTTLENPIPDNDADTVFTNELFDSLYPDGIEHHYWTKARNKLVYLVLKKLGADSKKIIEVGCGRGVVTKFLHEKKLDIQGMELATLVQYPGTDGYVHLGSDARLLPEEQRNSYEVMLLLDVVEHIADPVDFLKDLLSYFKNVKTVIITVPACQEIWSNFDVFNRHYRRYDMEMGHELLKSLNLRPVYSSYLYHSLYLIIRLLKFIQKNRNTVIRAPSNASRVFHYLLTQVLIADYKLISKNRKGSSLVFAALID